MKQEYADWIADQDLPQCPAGLCHIVASQMTDAFPELRLVRGHFAPWDGPRSRKWPHWWCETAEGAVIDPTVAQFAGLGPGDYVEHNGKEPTGRCLECGLYVFNAGSFCDDVCARRWNDDITAQSFQSLPRQEPT